MFNVSVIVWAECNTRYRQLQKITIHKNNYSQKENVARVCED